ncbi:AAA family ATPase [Mobilicoccus sp.]|uniref:AAA family ATPase n=1 Tax=Mobilicoccus sp. TaxID=2034349 RepID=UPI0037C9BC16
MDRVTPTAPTIEDASARDQPLEVARRLTRTVADAIDEVIEGKNDVVDLAVTVLFAGGHLLIEDVPGVGKTSLAKALAAAIGAPMRRIQFTPDLMPSDITGVSIYDPDTREFHFRPGAIFSTVVVCDEINRATPRAQSAVLECMEEGQVTVDGRTYGLDSPFFVVATQNPLEMAGTYPLPEAQRDRFMARIAMGYPDGDAEAAMLAHHAGSTPVSPAAVTTPAEVAATIGAIATAVHVSEAVRRYVVAVLEATRESSELRLGASPRAGLHLVRAARVRAAAGGRDHVLPDDVQDLLVPVLAHRVLPAGQRVAHDDQTAARAVLSAAAHVRP